MSEEMRSAAAEAAEAAGAAAEEQEEQEKPEEKGPTEEERRKIQEYLDQKNKPYAPRPKWQIIMAWVLLCIVILGVINICYWQITG